MFKLKVPTATSRVMEELVRADDFLPLGKIVKAADKTRNQVQAALHHLWIHRAVDFVQSGGTTYWFATPESDDRTRSHIRDELAPETKPRKKRKYTRRMKKEEA